MCDVCGHSVALAARAQYTRLLASNEMMTLKALGRPRSGCKSSCLITASPLYAPIGPLLGIVHILKNAILFSQIGAEISGGASGNVVSSCVHCVSRELCNVG